MKLADRLLFEVEYPSGTWNEVNPVNEDFVFSKTKEEGQFFYRLQMETKPTFSKDASWDFISDIELNDHCADLNLRVTCPMEGGVTLYEGKIKLSKSDFDFSRCVASVGTETEDNYTCIKNGLKQEVNLLDLITTGDRKTLNLSLGTLEYAYCPGPSSYNTIVVPSPTPLPEQTGCLTELDGWVLLENRFINISPVAGAPPYTADARTVWVRHTLDSATTPPGTGWVNIGGTTWVREPEVEFDFDNSSTGGFADTGTFNVIFKLVYADLGPIDNGMHLQDVLTELLGTGGINCPLSIVSNFFSINPDGTEPSNDAYTESAANLADVLVFQKSDVKRWDAGENATNGKMKLEELFEWMATMFKVFPSVDGTTLRIEHISYYESKPVGLDLTAAAYSRWMANKYKYSYNTDRLPRYEYFEWMDNDSTTARMATLGLQYGGACSAEGEEVTNVASRVNPDLAAILNNPDRFADDGFVFVAAYETGGEYYAIEEEIQGTSQVALNGHLSFRNLIPNYHKWYAYQENVTGQDIVSFTVESTRPLKEGEPITLPGWCCTDFINFDPDSTVITQIGDGGITRFEFRVNRGEVTINHEY